MRVRSSRAPQPLDLYKIAVDEYRFQVNLNWQRTQYLLGLNLAVFAAGIALLEQENASNRLLVSFVFFAGAMMSFYALRAFARQKEYYETTCSQLKTIGSGVAEDEMLIRTTPELGSSRRSSVSVTALTGVVVALIGFLNLAAIAVVQRFDVARCLIAWSAAGVAALTTLIFASKERLYRLKRLGILLVVAVAALCLGIVAEVQDQRQRPEVRVEMCDRQGAELKASGTIQTHKRSSGAVLSVRWFNDRNERVGLARTQLANILDGEVVRWAVTAPAADHVGSLACRIRSRES